MYREGKAAGRLLLADSSSDAPPSPTVPPSSKWLQQNWAVLISITVVSTMVFLIISLLLYCLDEGQGLDKSEVHQCRTKIRGAVSRTQEEDGGLNYATLEIRKGPKRPKAPRAQPSDFCTYSEVNSSRV